MKNTPLIFCAIDTKDINHAIALSKDIAPITKGLKLGLEFFNHFGPQGVETIRNACPNAHLFLDLKLHDIPNTVASTVRSITENLAPTYLNVHASGGKNMMEAAAKACNNKTQLLSVTILTSIDEKQMDDIGYKFDIPTTVNALASLTQTSGLSGVVCSPLEIKTLRNQCGSNFILMVPGIRPVGSANNDQKRIKTPQEALQDGATHLVIGRPITQAPNPGKKAQEILNSLQENQ